jgi:hypothetical protein
MLKALCGFLASGNATKNGQRIEPVGNVPACWLHCLFYAQPLPGGCGLYFMNAEAFVPGVKLTTISNAGKMMGSLIELNGLKFCLAMQPHYANDRGELLKDAIHRPCQLTLATSEATHDLVFAWNHKGDDKRVEIAVHPAERHNVTHHS